mmetsp:Transcript_39137/g.66721  ORF Transcript_39137/g.66721 Transcript_39137/m.66721 type:complete len:263 (-) Transcript_39137:54-842(-)|eukprot:CAMPEP_0183759946 /NCGR_PEP_ID=MMETSP0739-20130205/7419_1 /TAXON_ID=385413 /ORGANISM="Thalassiosira miniscula, Strain CCMP1093" /LENGTH=262 /DNA_ID=CAMNT_0025997817 /DNA_START=641 /DNA_END=1429 /DNA_ORIENTATION=-
MVQDDNVRGAVPVRLFQHQDDSATIGSSSSVTPCPWKKNSPGYFYLCLHVRLEFHRKDDELRLYLDARGERDLRNPKDSSIEWRVEANTNDGSQSHGFVPNDANNLISGEFISEVAMPGHFKGYLSFYAGHFKKTGKYYFNFADCRRNTDLSRMIAVLESEGVPTSTAILVLKDYPEIFLFEVPEEGGLIKAFANGDGNMQYALPVSPFKDESEEEEKRRFGPFLGNDVLKRHEAEGGRYKWWVGANDNVDPEPQRILMGLM